MTGNCKPCMCGAIVLWQHFSENQNRGTKTLLYGKFIHPCRFGLLLLTRNFKQTKPTAIPLIQFTEQWRQNAPTEAMWSILLHLCAHMCRTDTYACIWCAYMSECAWMSVFAHMHVLYIWFLSVNIFVPAWLPIDLVWVSDHLGLKLISYFHPISVV